MILARLNREKVPFIVTLAIGLACFIVVWGLRQSGALEGLELRAYDAYLRRQPLDDRLQPHVVIIGIDEQDIQAGGYPVPDDVMAQLINRLIDYGAASVGVDI